jgi:hypothetical protein
MMDQMETETVTKKLFTVDEFVHLYDAGILPEERRFELIHGEIFEMPPAGPPHIGAVNRLTMLFAVRLGHSVVVSVQNGILIDRVSMPQPDLVVLKPRSDFYSDSHAKPEDILWIVELAHTTQRHDVKIKAPLYAEAGIAEYWIVDIKKHVLEVRTVPQPTGYAHVQLYRAGDSITLQKRPKVTFLVDDILGSPSSVA